MSGGRHPTPAERLLALLADEGAIETLPAGDVRADLAGLGIDPSRCVAFARALAHDAGSPGARLLGAIDMAEEEEENEIARLESADIEEVRARIPEGTAAAVAAAARRQAGADSNIVAMRPRRSRILRWGGPLAGIAASVLVAAVVTLQYLSPARQIVSRDNEYYSMAPQAEAPAEGATRADEADSVARDARPEAQKQKRAAAEPEAEADTERLAKQELREAAPPAAAPQVPAAGLLGNANEEPALADRAADDVRGRRFAAEPEGTLTEELAAKPDAGAAMGGGALSIAAMVVVDPSQVPLAVQSQAAPRPDLAARVGEARRLAGDRPIIALYRIAGPAGRQDFAQVPLAPAMTQQMPAPAPLTQLLGPDALRYDFLALPAE